MKKQSNHLEVLDYTFNGEAVHFQLFGGNVMVNATEMGKIFGKFPKDFLKNETTKSFIEECLREENSPILGIQNEDDLYRVEHGVGTWMHRILALDFAAWLNPKFKLWVWITIDHIMYSHLKKMEGLLKESAERRNKLKKVMENLLANPDFLELQQLQLQERQATYLRGKVLKNQRDIFEEMMFNS
jgi:hypothetical protein